MMYQQLNYRLYPSIHYYLYTDKMGSGSSKPKQAKKTPNPQPTKNNTKSAPVPTQTIVPRIAETNPDKMETKPDPVETKANPKEVNQAETDGSHVAWRDVNVASLIHENPDEPWWEIADKLVPNALTVVKPDLHVGLVSL